jgi:hypothetical protein
MTERTHFASQSEKLRSMAEIHFKMVNGDRHVLTIREGQDIDEVVRNARDDPGGWITVDDETFVRRENVVAMQLFRERGSKPLAEFT